MDELAIRSVLDFALAIRFERGLKKNPSLAIFNPTEYAIHTFATCAMGYNAFPQVIGDKKYRALKRKTLFHGGKQFDHLARLLCDFDYHYGSGLVSNGTFFSFHKTRAEDYTGGHHSELVLRAKLDPSARVLTTDKIAHMRRDLETGKTSNADLNQLLQILDSYNAQDRSYLNWLLRSPNGLLAMLLGYDAIIDFPINDVIVLNRSKLIVSESELNRITDQSRLYKWGIIDFEKKYEEDAFLNE